MKKLTRHPLFQKILIHVAALYARFVYATARIRLATPLPAAATQGPVVFTVWHQQIAFAPALMRQSGRPLLALMSGSRDGTAIRLLAQRFGIRAAVGSSHRGAVAGTRELLRAAKGGSSLFITPDGPRGPARRVKPGAIEVARLTQLPLVPCAMWCNRGKTLGSWDAFRLPYPFATLTLAIGAPLANATPETLQQALNTLTAQAQAAAGCLVETGATL